jgi:outer membrane protein OmpA-like peptidoglycan-associated protein
MFLYLRNKKHSTPITTERDMEISSQISIFGKTSVVKTCLFVVAMLPMVTTFAQTTAPNLVAQSTSTPAITPNAKAVGVAPVEPTIVFRRISGEDLSLQNTLYTSSINERLWRDSLGLSKGSKILLNASSAKAPADNQSQINVKVELFDNAGKPVLKPTKIYIETSLGSFQTFNSPFHTLDAVGALRKVEINRLEVAVTNGIAELVLKAPGTPGTALLKASSGDVVVQGEISFLPDLRSMLVVGIVEGAINLSKAKGPSAGDIKEFGFTDTLRNWEKSTSTISSDGVEYKTVAGRVALFAKGTIKGEYLLTAAVDTDKITSQKLFRDIDPNTFYGVYGDASSKFYDAQSASRLYVRIDKDKSYLLYGDFNTASTDPANKLAIYSRALTGGKFHYENDSVQGNIYAAQTANKGYVDEQPARGISGPYALERPNAIANTETVELVVRNRAQPAIILSKTRLARYSDYDFEPFSGRILFREPVPSVDENNNPVYIRISYEVDEDFGDKHWVGGVDAKVKLTDQISIGAAYAKDNDQQTPYEIAGANIEVKLGDKTYIVVEAAQSKGTNAYNQSFSSITDANPLVATQGKAARVEMRHEGDYLKGRIYATKSDPGFQNASAGVIAGRTELGANINYVATPNLELSVNALKTKDESGGITDGASRDSVGVTAAYKLNDTFKVELGVNSVKEYLINGSGGALTNVGTGLNNNAIPGWGFNGTGLLSTPSTLLSAPSDIPSVIENEYTSGRIKLIATVSQQANVYTEYEQAFSDAEKKRFTVGAEYKFSEKTRLYASHEITNTLTGVYGLANDGTRNASTIIGMSSALALPFIPDGQVYGEFRSAGPSGNRDIAAVAGIRNLWQVNPSLNFTTALERQQIYQATGVEHEATALSLGVEYMPNASNKVNGKLEYRTSDVQNQWLGTLAYTRNLSENWSALGREAYIRSEGRGLDVVKGIQLQNQLQVGLAYRDVATGRWNGLMRLENRINRSSITADLKDEETWIFSLHGTYRMARNWTWAGQLAAKHGSQAIINDGSYNIYSGRLASGRVIWDINDRFDASLYGSYGRDNGQKVTGVGVELGAKVVQNLWFSAGYTKGRFADVDQFSANTSWSGWHARLRYKFDENSLGLATKRAEEPKPVAAIEAAMQVAPVTVPVAIVVPIAPVVLTPATPVIVVQATPAAKYEKITLAAGALFAHNKSAVDQILPEGRTQLNNLAAKLKTLTNVEKITISGHADITNGTGDASYNDSLSLARAAAVKSYMATQGLNVSQVSVSGFGGLKPVKTDCAMPKGAVTTKIGVIRGNASSKDMDNLRTCLLPNRRVDVEIFGQAITN